MNNPFTQTPDARALKTMWLEFRKSLGGAGARVASCHGNAHSVRRAGRSLTSIEIERLIFRLTQRGGGRDGAVQPGFLGNSYRIGIS